MNEIYRGGTYRTVANGENIKILVRAPYGDAWMQSHRFVWAGCNEWKATVSPAKLTEWVALLEQHGCIASSRSN